MQEDRETKENEEGRTQNGEWRTENKERLAKAVDRQIEHLLLFNLLWGEDST